MFADSHGGNYSVADDAASLQAELFVISLSSSSLDIYLVVVSSYSAARWFSVGI